MFPTASQPWWRAKAIAETLEFFEVEANAVALALRDFLAFFRAAASERTWTHCIDGMSKIRTFRIYSLIN
jgi:hypothetical protein